MNSLTIGDVVQLKSGGPKMTVCSTEGKGGAYRCCWFNGKRVERADFQFETLKTVNDSDNTDYIDTYGY